MEKKASPLTGIEVQYSRDARNGVNFYEDPISGPYAVGDLSRFDALSIGDKRKIAMVLATKTLRMGKSAIWLTKDTSGTHDAWELVPISALLDQYPKDVVTIFDEALLNLSKMIEFPSETVRITRENCWYIFANDDASVQYVIRQLEDLGFVKSIGFDGVLNYPVPILNIEAKGWARLRELREDSSQSNLVFVAMWFSKGMRVYFDKGVYPAIREAGFDPHRIDFKEHNNKICDEIVADIRRSRFVVADFTGNRGGVYYEAGFAHGLGKPVIWTVREDRAKRLHFDTRQYNHILYTTPEELREKLLNRIRATQS